MTLEQFWTILVKQWKLILICFVAVGLGTYIGSKFMTRLYQSSALVQVAIRANNNNQVDYNNLLASDQLVDTEAQLATSNTVLRAVASKYPGLTPEALAKEVTSTAKLNTQLFEIDVLDTSPTRAAALANDIAATLIKQQLQETQLANSRFLQELQQDLDVTQQQIDATTTQIATLQAKGGNQTAITVLQIHLGGLFQWQTALAQLKLAAVQNGDYLHTAQAAEPNPKPVQPNVLLNTGEGLLVGLLLGMLLAVLYEQLDMRVRSPEALTKLLDWPALATIWQARSSKKEDVLNPTEHDGNVEAYRILRTNIGFSGIDKPLHSLLVTSAMLCDGKSVIAANLAIFMARAGKTTLLIDANLRRPIQHELFDLSSDKMGLSNAVLAFSTSVNANTTSHRFFSSTVPTQPSNISTTTGLSFESFIHAVAIPNLWVMPSGPLPPNPPELLDSKAMQYLFTEFANCGIEMVIFDAPCLLGLSDASILASKVDGTLVVVDITCANKGSLKQAKALLMQAGAHVAGCVVNKQRRKSKEETPYYYYHTDGKSRKNHHTTENGNSTAVPVSIFAVPQNAVDPTVLDGRQGEDHES